MPKAHLLKAERLDRPEYQLAAYEELRIWNDFIPDSTIFYVR